MVSAMEVYRRLFKHFGSQGWWPTTKEGNIKPDYRSSPKTKNHSESEKFEICVGAILTQNTAWTNVEKALIQLQQNRLVSPENILRAPFHRLAKVIRSSGYFRQKAKKLKIFCRYLTRNYNGKVGGLLKNRLESARAELLALYGMGPETVDSILLYAGGLPVFVVDAYTKRIGNRIGLFRTEDYMEIQNYFQKRLDSSAALFNEFHALLVALGKNICRTKPLCGECPLQRICETGLRFKTI